MYCIWVFVINCNEIVVNSRIDLLDGVGDMKVIGLVEFIWMINCKGILFNGIVDDVFMKFFICRVMVYLLVGILFRLLIVNE